MTEVLRFIFHDFWTWLGTAILLGIVFSRPLIALNVNRKDKP